MERKVLITECYNKLLTVLIENNEVVELHYHPQNVDGKCNLGEIYVGKVKQIVPNINAAFVEIQKGVECYYPLDEKCEPVYANKPSKKQEVCIGDEIIVQIQKEAIKTKLPMVSCNLNFTGNYVVLTTGDCKIGVSSKLSKETRAELQLYGKQYENETYGIVFRTNAASVSYEEIQKEIFRLEEKLKKVITFGKKRTCYSKLLGSVSPVITDLQNFRQTDFIEIVVDATIKDGALYKEVEAYLREEHPEMLDKLRAYKDMSYPMRKCYRLEHITDEARSEKVWMKSGAYLVIQPTEALTVIDVNSGKCLKKGKSFYDINKEAAKEAAKQIRLRNLTGIIVVDFVNMMETEDKDALIKYFQQELNKDSNAGKVVDMTKLQLVEVTRKKGRKTLEESLNG